MQVFSYCDWVFIGYYHKSTTRDYGNIIRNMISLPDVHIEYSSTSGCASINIYRVCSVYDRRRALKQELFSSSFTG